ncbi:conserved hypothetical protein [Acidovorax delafieldii 2AN]|uniref:DUF4400 domain-containing protein n=1 Tax=Acidovorax delafieldii 2AN TaxID=573060 RepID=C5T005_ACIDE|nr:DUF4400 domain-containing protein [Acidovorax delafieldii]EER62113.1 conserved hypothetical protein [Acidovorax delafieldii 2AN]
MIRAVAVISLVLLLILVLYVPAVHPPERFLEQLRSEHQVAVDFWGAEPAYRMLDRAIKMQSHAAEASPLPALRDMPKPQGVNRAVAAEMGSVNQRLFNNTYFRSVDALLMLASYRLSSLLEWLPWLIPLALAAGIDGLLLRVVRSKEFLLHDPEMFAVWCSLLIITGCATVVAFVLPIRVHPAMLAGSPIAMMVLLGRALTHFHRRA